MKRSLFLVIFVFLFLISFQPVVLAADCVEIVEQQDYYLIYNFSQGFSIRNQVENIDALDYSARLVGDPVGSWAYENGRSLIFEGGDNWSIPKHYFNSIPQRCGIIIKNLNTGETHWFISAFLCPDSRDNWERITDPGCENGGGDPVLVFPLAPPGYIGCEPDPEYIDDDGDSYTENQGDCNDENNLIYPGAIEICGDGIDQDCDGLDLSCLPGISVILSWGKPADNRVRGYKIYYGPRGSDFKNEPRIIINSENTTSCEISDLQAGTEYAFAATSCDGQDRESAFSETLYYLVPDANNTDEDGDGYTENQGDCDDDDYYKNPGRNEICGDGIDQDCDGEDLSCPSVTCVIIQKRNNDYLFKNFSAGFSVCREGEIILDPAVYEVRIVGNVVGSWQFVNGLDMIFLSGDTWSLDRSYFTEIPEKIGIIARNKNTGEEYWFITYFLCPESKNTWERTTDPACPHGGGDKSLVFPEASPGYLGCD